MKTVSVVFLKFLRLFFYFFLIGCIRNDTVIVRTVEELCIDFETNKEISLQNYQGQVLEITGHIVSQHFPKDTRPFFDTSCILFGAVDENLQPTPEKFVIEAYFDSFANVPFDLESGTRITIRGKFSRIIENAFEKVIWIRHCEIIR
jgi:hypothetical protein